MNEISLPYHLIIPSLVSMLFLVMIIRKRKTLYKLGKWKWFWISTTVFFGIYLLIVGGAAFTDISLDLSLQKFDLNGDGVYKGEEITSEQQDAMRKVNSDIGRNLSIFTGLVFSGIIALFVFIVGKVFDYINVKRVNTTNNTL